MGKAERNRRLSTREKIAAQQAAARRAELRRRGLIAGGAVLAVIAVVVVLVVVKVGQGPSSASSSASVTASGDANTGVRQPASVVDQITSIPVSALTAVGTGSTSTDAVQTIKGQHAILTKSDKPAVVFVGAEYCPYCGAERWAITAALSRFGTFSGLRFIHSSSTDVYASTPTLTFLKATYSSKYLTFESTEARNETDTANLQPLTALDNKLMSSYDAPPYVTSSEAGSYPFVDFADKYVIDGASYSPQVLHGLTWAQVAADLKDPSSPVAQGIDGTTNLISAAICKVTGGKPGSVCTSAGVTKASGSI